MYFFITCRKLNVWAAIHGFKTVAIANDFLLNDRAWTDGTIYSAPLSKFPLGVFCSCLFVCLLALVWFFCFVLVLYSSKKAVISITIYIQLSEPAGDYPHLCVTNLMTQIS